MMLANLQHSGIFAAILWNFFLQNTPDATFMRMKDDHMRNAQLKPGYNLQLAVSGEYIVGVDISSYRNDNMTLIGFVKKVSRYDS